MFCLGILVYCLSVVFVVSCGCVWFVWRCVLVVLRWLICWFWCVVFCGWSCWLCWMCGNDDCRLVCCLWNWLIILYWVVVVCIVLCVYVWVGGVRWFVGGWVLWFCIFDRFVWGFSLVVFCVVGYSIFRSYGLVDFWLDGLM